MSKHPNPVSSLVDDSSPINTEFLDDARGLKTVVPITGVKS